MDNSSLRPDDSLAQLAELFSAKGGHFLQSASFIKDKLTGVSVLLFDWDGVFTDGRKDSNRNSTYSELDTMGINLLRFAFWLQNGAIPFTAIITGEENPGAMFVARRDRFDAVYYHVKDKSQMEGRLLADFNVSVSESLFLFDDVLDLGLVEATCISFALRNNASHLFQQYIRTVQKCGYITANTGGEHGIREVCELLMGCMGLFTAVIEHRAAFTPLYRGFLSERNLKTEPVLYSFKPAE